MITNTNKKKHIIFCQLITEAPGPPIITTTTAHITASGQPIAGRTTTSIHQYHMQQQLIISLMIIIINRIKKNQLKKINKYFIRHQSHQ